MPSKHEFISSLAAHTAEDITANAAKYMSFLRTAANNYKYSFWEQLLIHAQKPSATACADVETWNKLGRWVNKGTKGIALLAEQNVPYKLRYVFDVSDTNSFYGHTVSLWRLKERYRSETLDALEDNFGALDEHSGFEHDLIKIVEIVVDDNFEDYRQQLLSVKDGSLLEELDELNTDVWLKSTLKSSVGFMLLARCGIEPGRYYSREDFATVYDFNTVETVTVLGEAASDISEMMLRQVELTVRAAEKSEKTQNRTFAKEESNRHNDGRNQNERSLDHETDIQDGGRLPVAESERSGEPELWEVRDDAAQLSEGAQERNLLWNAALRETELPPRRDRPSGRSDDAPADIGNGEDAGRDGELESIGSDALGAEDEQHPERSGGNGSDGADLQLSEEVPHEPLPTVEEQQNRIEEAEADKSSAFAISQEDIDAVLTRGSGVSHGKFRIYEQYLKKESAADNIKMLKDEYGVGGAYPAAHSNGRELDESHDAKGIQIGTGSITNPDATVLLTWPKIARRIGELIDVDRYLNAKEKEAYPAYVREKELREKRNGIAAEFRSLIRDYNDYQQQIANPDAMVDQYVLSTCAGCFIIGEKKTWTQKENNYVLPLMRNALNHIISENTHHMDRAKALLSQLSGPLAAPFEPTYDELNPPPEPPKEYRFSLGDIVYIGAQEYDIVSLDGDNVTLYDPNFPLFTKELSRSEFESKVKENPLNDKYLVVVEEKESPNNTQMRISLNSGDDLVHWIYFNPDADAGGQYVSGDLSFSVYEELIEQYDIANHPENVEKFAADLEEMSDQFLADINTPFFMEAENDYEMDCDYIEFTPDNILKIHQDIQSFEVDREAQRATDAYEAEFGADGTRVFRETEPVYQVGDVLQIGADNDVPEYRVISSQKTAFDENNSPITMYGFDAYWDKGLQHFKFSNTGALPSNQPIKVIGRRDEKAQDSYAAVKEVLRGYYEENFPGEEVNLDFDDYHAVQLAYSTDGEGEHEFVITADLIDHKIVFQADNEPLTSIQCANMDDLCNHISELSFDSLIGFAELAFKQAEKEKKRPVGRIDFLGANGEVGESVEYDDADALIAAVKEENQYGAPMIVALYRDENGNTIPRDFTAECDPPLKGLSIEDAPGMPDHYIDHYYVVEDLQAVPLEIKTFSEREKALNEYFYLPTGKMKAFGVMNTNDLPGSLDFIQCKDGQDVLIEDYLKVEEEAGWQNKEIIELVSELKEKLEAYKVPLAPPTPIRREKLPPHIIHPEIHSENRANYRINNNNLGIGTPSERFYHNVHAIELLKKLEREDRLATPFEQDIMADYVGWGGLSDCFDEKSSHYLELKELLTEDEYTAARESTLSAFYTPPVVIKAIYQGLANMGFQRGNILEPSCGVGNFMGLLPDSMQDAKMYGVELDSISGRIAQQLYQKNNIAVQGFEKTDLPDSFFDAAVGNVPFGQFKVPDKRYDKYNFLIHDYFFARALDKVRPGGVIAFITSKGTMDKENPNVRKYIAQRADLIGAIRLPNNTFKAAAGTEVTSDILFLQKRSALLDIEPDWVHLGTDANGLKMNQYFVDNPDMIMGEMKEVSGPYGPETACVPYDGQDLGELLNAAIQNINGHISDYEAEELADPEQDTSIPADLSVRNFSYCIVDGKIYYRENSRMNPVEVSATAGSRIKGMIGIRDCVRTLIEYQTEDYPDSQISAKQLELNELYDDFSKKYGILNSRANSSAFSSDSSFCLLCSLEILDDEGNFVRKADMFTKRTIKQKVIVTSVDTASEALALSLAEKAKVDMPYMMELTGKTEQEIFEDLKGVIFLNPMHTSENDGRAKYLPADEYLSGNVREKLTIAKRSAELYPEDYTPNVQALEAVQPVDLSASEISVRLGATWLPTEIVSEFMFGLFSTPYYCQWNIKVHYSEYTGEWNVEGKSYDRGNVKANSAYGTNRINGYKIIEETLNLRDVRIFDYIEDANGKKTAVLNKKETAIAQGKQELIKSAFAEWIWSDPGRRDKLTKLYNEKFNSIRPREYDGSHLNFVGINPEITLRKHQIDAIAHILYGGNTLLAHVVGAGKSATRS